MNILLILPFDSTYRFHGAFTQTLSYAPLTLTTLAALVPKNINSTITIIDEGVQPAAIPKAGFDVVGITCVTSSAPRAYDLAGGYRRAGSLTVLGGPHPTLCTDEAAQHADVVVTGPAEGSWPKLLHDVAEKRPLKQIYSGLYSSCQSDIVPARHLLPEGRYLSVPTVIASRGCVNRCAFCSINRLSNGRTYGRPVGDVVREIASITSRRVLFLDPNMIADREYALELFASLSPLHRRWAGLATIDLAFDGELLDAASRSGCIGILAGFESMNQASLDACGKSANVVAKYQEAIRILHAHRIGVLGCFVLGFDEDTPESLRDIALRADEIGVDIPRFAVLTPFPGTPLFKKMKAEKRIITEDWSQYDTEHVVFKPAAMEPDELQEALYHAWRQSYTITRIAKRTVLNHTRLLLSAVISLGFRYYSRRFFNRVCSFEKGPVPCR